MRIGLRKWIFFGVKDFFSKILIPKMDVKMNRRIITKNHAADPGIGFLAKSISKSYGRATAMPPAWESRKPLKNLLYVIRTLHVRLEKSVWYLFLKISVEGEDDLSQSKLTNWWTLEIENVYYSWVPHETNR